MGTLIHKIEYFSEGTEVESNLWTGPVEGIIEIAKATMIRNGADTARVVVEKTGEEIWSGNARV